MKKTLLNLGAIATLSIPVMAVVSCTFDSGDGKPKASDENKSNDNTGSKGKTDALNSDKVDGDSGLDRKPISSDKEEITGNSESIKNTKSPEKNPNTELSEKPKTDNSIDATKIENKAQEILDRSGKVISEDDNKNWMIESESTKDQKVIKANIYHTALFDYVVEEGVCFEGVLMNRDVVERIAKIFEANTSIGTAHYDFVRENTNKVYKKSSPIQFLKGKGRFSWGGSVAVRMIRPDDEVPIKGKTASQIDSRAILDMAELVLHEYGHHETMFGASADIKGGGYGATWARFETDMKADPILKKYTAYFDKGTAENMGGQDFSELDWKSPWGVIPKGESRWSSKAYNYIFSTGEFVTRLLSELEGTLTPGAYTGKNYMTLDKMDALAMYEAFGDHPLLDTEALSHLKAIYEKDIFGFNSRTGNEGTLQGYLDMQGKGPQTKLTYTVEEKNAGWLGNQLKVWGLADNEISIWNEWITKGEFETTINVTKDSFDDFLVEYRFNKSVVNGVYDTDIIRGNYYVIKEKPTYDNEELGDVLAKVQKLSRQKGYSVITSTWE